MPVVRFFPATSATGGFLLNFGILRKAGLIALTFSQYPINNFWFNLGSVLAFFGLICIYPRLFRLSPLEFPVRLSLRNSSRPQIVTIRTTEYRKVQGYGEVLGNGVAGIGNFWISLYNIVCNMYFWNKINLFCCPTWKHFKATTL